MRAEELGKLYPIIIKPYCSNWELHFFHEKVFLHDFLGEKLRIEHIGSTSVNGLSAKPTIDILVEQPDNLSNHEIISLFESNGYIHMKEQTNHLMFVKGYTPTGLDDISFHIHMAPLTERWLWDRMYFSAYLSLNTDYRKEYEELKKQLAKKYKNDREAYTQGKSQFIYKVTEEAKNVMKTGRIM